MEGKIASQKENYSIEQFSQIIKEYGARRFTRGYLTALREQRHFREKRKHRMDMEFNKVLDQITKIILDNKKIK